MSFATDVKNEISDLRLSKSENIAELSAFIRNNGHISKDSILLYTENMMIAKRVYAIVKNIYGIHSLMTTKQNVAFNKNNVYYIEIKEKIDFILKDLSVNDEKGNLLDSPKDYIVDSEEEMKAYIRGAFLSKGSINDPKTSQYHLEFLFDKKYESVFVQRLLNNFGLNSKILLRDTKYMVYLKEAEKIADFLKLIKAYKSVLYYEDVRVLREQKNITNRLNNCEQANTEKVIATCNNQLKDIDDIERIIGLDILDDKVKLVAEYRRKYPESSLVELSEIISLETQTPITKSGLNHRFRKIKEIADRLRKNEEKE
ncbi:MAG: DNA-binding protein WhiA [Bacilli bacterium]|nr:DNA-binding protein WhiA [Bacilli bacterium]